MRDPEHADILGADPAGEVLLLVLAMELKGDEGVGGCVPHVVDPLGTGHVAPTPHPAHSHTVARQQRDVHLAWSRCALGAKVCACCAIASRPPAPDTCRDTGAGCRLKRPGKGASLGSEAHGTPPVLEFDPFADAFRGDPEGFYAPVREAGASGLSRTRRHLAAGPVRRGPRGTPRPRTLLLRDRERQCRVGPNSS
jgi:hypothetical protein